MIKAFLICALALPASRFPHQNLSAGEIAIFKILSKVESANNGSGQRLIFIGNVPNWVAQLRGNRLKAFGVSKTFVPAAYYVQAELFRLPILRNSMQVVTYLSHNLRWKASLLLNYLIPPIALGGFFVFDHDLCPFFDSLLKGAGWLETRFQFHQFGVYQKMRATRNDGLPPSKNLRHLYRPLWEDA